jgi:hypothetical protein
MALVRGLRLVNTAATPRVEMFSILFSQTLGTALGDWMADTNGLGYERGAAVFAAGLVVVAAGYVQSFWASQIKPLGGAQIRCICLTWHNANSNWPITDHDAAALGRSRSIKGIDHPRARVYDNHRKKHERTNRPR